MFFCFSSYEQYQRAIAKALVDRVSDDDVSTTKTVRLDLPYFIFLAKSCLVSVLPIVTCYSIFLLSYL